MAATHFITAKTFHRKRIFQNELFGEVLTDALMQWRQADDMLLHDYVIMPDHIHLLVTGSSDEAVLSEVEKLQRVFTAELAQQYGYAGEVWEPKFRDVKVQNATECEQCTRMIHSNPVRMGFCDKPGQYRMSSHSSRWVLDPLPEPLRALQLA